MASAPLAHNRDYAEFFRCRVLDNLRYWQDYVANHASETAAPDSERDRILTAIIYALNLDEAWPRVRELIVAFSSYMERRG